MRPGRGPLVHKAGFRIVFQDASILPAPGGDSCSASSGATRANKKALAGWFHPLRRNGPWWPECIRLRSEGKKNLMVRAVGLEPTLSLPKNGFSYLPTAFAALGVNQGLGSGLSLRQPDFTPVEALPV